ncbi:amino acid--tRNA ligase-related protein [Spirochaetia bacterium 38H-sp]|uniref:Amino acid--tRNA ligase-related protein n=1 Tax=Rarispira pelagica TaxID=3141764 RepID=A0ABU9UB98_9SPIR
MIDKTTARIRSQLLRTIREYFYKNGYIETDTPILSPTLIPEAHIENFSTTYIDTQNKEHTLYLTPSPEIWLKRLIAQGYDKIYQITKSFRNTETLTTHHNPEFTMLEWYTIHTTHTEQIQITQNMLKTIAEEIPCPILKKNIEIISMEDAFKKHAGFSLLENYEHKKLQKQAEKLNMNINTDEEWEDTFHRIFLTHVEPYLPQDRPIALTDYPADIPCLAENLPKTPWKARWELYIKGIEIANCYQEARKEEELTQFYLNQADKKSHSKTPVKPDKEITEISKKMPPVSGVALGIDRLLMIVSNKEDIRGVIFFPFFDKIV